MKIFNITKRFASGNCGLKFIDTADLCSEEIHRLLWICFDLKARVKNYKTLGRPLKHRRVTLLCQRQCNCIHFIVQAAARSLGADLRIMVSPRWELSMFKGDIGRFHGLYADLILAQSRNHLSVCELMKGAAPVPVVNIISHMFSPLHGLGTLVTLQEHFGHLSDLTVAWVGPMGNHLNTLLYLLPKAGVHLRYNCAPKPEHPSSPIVKPKGVYYCETHNTRIEEYCNPEETIRGADVIGTSKHREDTLKIEMEMLRGAKDGWVFLHMLPRWENDVCEEVFHHRNSLVWKLHENIYYATMAIILEQLEGYTPIIARPDFGKPAL